VRDFGAGIGVDELIGLSAGEINRLRLPADQVFHHALQAARLVIRAGLTSHVLVELWEDGHSVWNDSHEGLPVVLSPDGKIVRTESR